MQSVLILKTAEFPPRLGLVQVGTTEKSNRSPEYLSRGSCGAGNLTFLIAFLPEKKSLEQQTRDAQKSKREVE